VVEPVLPDTGHGTAGFVKNLIYGRPFLTFCLDIEWL